MTWTQSIHCLNALYVLPTNPTLELIQQKAEDREVAECFEQALIAMREIAASPHPLFSTGYDYRFFFLLLVMQNNENDVTLFFSSLSVKVRKQLLPTTHCLPFKIAAYNGNGKLVSMFLKYLALPLGPPTGLVQKEVTNHFTSEQLYPAFYVAASRDRVQALELILKACKAEHRYYMFSKNGYDALKANADNGGYIAGNFMLRYQSKYCCLGTWLARHGIEFFSLALNARNENFIIILFCIASELRIIHVFTKTQFYYDLAQKFMPEAMHHLYMMDDSDHLKPEMLKNSFEAVLDAAVDPILLIKSLLISNKYIGWMHDFLNKKLFFTRIGTTCIKEAPYPNPKKTAGFEVHWFDVNGYYQYLGVLSCKTTPVHYYHSYTLLLRHSRREDGAEPPLLKGIEDYVYYLHAMTVGRIRRLPLEIKERILSYLIPKDFPRVHIGRAIEAARRLYISDEDQKRAMLIGRGSETVESFQQRLAILVENTRTAQSESHIEKLAAQMHSVQLNQI